MTENLKHCPFCGSEAKCIEFYGLYHVICCNCHIAGKDCPTRESAVSAWNTRPIEDALQKELDEAREDNADNMEYHVAERERLKVENKRLREALEHAVTTDTTVDKYGIWRIDGKTFQTWAADVLKGGAE